MIRDVYEDHDFRRELIAWFRANGVDTKLLPADPGPGGTSHEGVSVLTRSALTCKHPKLLWEEVRPNPREGQPLIT